MNIWLVLAFVLLALVVLVGIKRWNHHQRQRAKDARFFPLQPFPKPTKPSSRTDTVRPPKHLGEGADFDAIVIGSGLSGLTAAWFLCRAGKRVLVLEQHEERNGGCLHTFSKKGYEFDSGLHYVGNMADAKSTPRLILDEVTRGAVEWVSQGDVYDVVHVPDLEPFALTHDGPVAIERALARRFPAERESLHRWFELLKRCGDSFATLFTHRMLCAFGAPRWVRALYRLKCTLAPSTAQRLKHTTAGDLLRKCGIRTPHLCQILNYAWGDVGEPPELVSGPLLMAVHAHYMKAGGFYPRGGSRRIAQHIIRGIQDMGGAVWMGVRVSDFVVEDNRIRGVRSPDLPCIVRAPVVVSSIGLYGTCRFVPNLYGTCSRKPYTMSFNCTHLVLFVGLDVSGASLGLDSANHWFHPTTDEGVQHFVSFPSMKDPDWRHADKSTCQLIAPTTFYPWPNPKTDAVTYASKKAETQQTLLNVLFSYFPKLRGHVETVSLGTPHTINRYLGRICGESYGLANTPERYAAEWLRPDTPLAGLYLTGQDILTPGITSAAESGLITASVVLKRNLYSDLERKRKYM